MGRDTQMGSSRGGNPLPYQGSGLGGIKLGMVWIGVNPPLMTSSIRLTMATKIVGITIAIQCNHVTSHFITPLLTDGNFNPSYFH